MNDLAPTRSQNRNFASNEEDIDLDEESKKPSFEKNYVNLYIYKNIFKQYQKDQLGEIFPDSEDEWNISPTLSEMEDNKVSYHFDYYF